MDRQLASDLADSPVQLWPKLIARYEVLLPLFDRKRLSVDEVDDAAMRLSVSRRRCYSLLAEFRMRRRDGSSYSNQTGRKQLITRRQEEAIREAYLAIGREARLAAIWAKVDRICRVEGIRPPSISAIRSRISGFPAEIDLKACFKLNTEHVADFAALSLDVSIQSKVAQAHIGLIFCASTSRIIGHELHAGRPHEDAMRAYLATGPESAKVRSLRSSSIIRRVFGPMIGRIPVRYPDEAKLMGRPHPCVRYDVADQVIAGLVKRRNEVLD